MPTRIASLSARSRWVSRRAGSELTHRDVPSAAALRPSSVVASFQVTNGRPDSTANVQARLTARASSASSPPSTSTPAARSLAAPPRATGFVSDWANTTRATPAATSACGAGAGAAGVVARLERDDGGAAASAVAGPGERVDLGVRRSRAPVEPLRDRRTGGVEEDTPDAGVGAERHAGRGGELEGARHRGALCVPAGHRGSALSSVLTDSGRREGAGASGHLTHLCSSHPDFHRRSRSSTWSTGCWLQPGRGLSPPARNCTDPRARELFTRRASACHTRQTTGM